MIKQMSKVTVIFLVLLIASSATITVAASPQQVTEPCQCVKYVTNQLFGIDKKVDGKNIYSWPNGFRFSKSKIALLGVCI